MSRKFFADSDDSGSDFDAETTDLPFPKPLSRESFLAPDFDPATFLASLTNRHQTLEDLRLELRELSQGLSKELLDLVNENYQDFLSLGNALKGGDEKVEEVRVGLLGFQRDVSAIQAKVEARKAEMQSLLEDKKGYRVKTNIGRALLDIAERIDELELRLMISGPEKETGVPDASDDVDSEVEDFDNESSDSDGDLEDDDHESTLISLKRLQHNVQKYVYITIECQQVGQAHPFLVNQESRLQKIKSTLLLDLDTALKRAKKTGNKGEARTAKIQHLYDILGVEASEVRAV
ncbi:oligomeric golgi complex component, COG2-domain-containing protein [Talaromyces proteolyticus]|uniref:Conserved oligomeric Golgi complex subunit 2 n=1 Tax=Talaromyces proteolyticus TaxID=1131652 RepID=A0AAD4KVU6_9EURO|nr:oligomeric golgi complex component, COG2-domain-containing protein [Talaromyces proteolyticus]KAH8702163.1 oligomeric golgi complex component, COG2-domain-containing protein [Talaromyces proteolyticus]